MRRRHFPEGLWAVLAVSAFVVDTLLHSDATRERVGAVMPRVSADRILSVEFQIRHLSFRNSSEEALGRHIFDVRHGVSACSFVDFGEDISPDSYAGHEFLHQVFAGLRPFQARKPSNHYTTKAISCQ